MLKWMRGKRFDMKTTMVAIVITLLAWAVVIYVNIQEFVPDEYTEERGP